MLHGRRDLEALAEGTVVIRSHGVPEEIYRLIEERGLTCVDATCPFVRKIHRIVEKYSREALAAVYGSSAPAGSDSTP